MDNRPNDTPYRITVVIPAYNAGRYVGRALDSVLAQTYPAAEILVVDDGSTDETGRIARSYGPPVRCIRQENAGVSAARNTGVEAAGGDWIAFLDADDEWLVDKLRLQVGLLRRNPELVWTAGNFIRCLCAENRRGPDIDPARARRLLAGCEFFDSYFTAYRQGSGGWTGTMLIRKQALQEAGRFPVGRQKGEDLDMWWRIAYRHPAIGYVPEPLAVYHMNIPESISMERFAVTMYCALLDEHLVLSGEHGRRAEFERFTAFLVRRWIRGMLFQEQGPDVRRMLRRYERLLPAWYVAVMRLLTAFPRCTARACHGISRLVRFFKLRRRITRAPRK
ncbi:MAG: glycosyltransferase family 2 protein [Sedimentisphaerales bacterium]|nr:glycosyltransferase family 2 protein [Sedimentisphaerales bacterium]